jgi:hypothetical protein
MRQHGSNMDVQDYSCRAMFDVLRDSSHDKLASAGAAGAVEVLVCALLTFPADMCIQEYGCAALHTLVAEHEGNVVKAGTCGAVEAVTALLRMPNTEPRMLAVACKVLRHLIMMLTGRVCEQNLRRAIDAGAFDAVVAAVRSNFADEALAAHGCLAVWSMLANGACCCQEGGRDLKLAVDTAALVMRSHSQDAHLQAAGDISRSAVFVPEIGVLQQVGVARPRGCACCRADSNAVTYGVA